MTCNTGFVPITSTGNPQHVNVQMALFIVLTTFNVLVVVVVALYYFLLLFYFLEWNRTHNLSRLRLWATTACPIDQFISFRKYSNFFVIIEKCNESTRMKEAHVSISKHLRA